MKRKTSQAFTLIELLVVMVIIGIIAAMIVGVSSLVNNKAARTRALGEIKAMSAACESYKADNGAYPRQTLVTEQDTGMPPPPLDPRVNENPLSTYYVAASLFLYEQLSGDVNGKLQPGATDANGVPAKIYLTFKPGQLSINNPGGSTVILPGTSTVGYIQDPFGNAYGYSTAAAKTEDDYKASVLQLQAPPPGAVNQTAATPPPRPSTLYGYNPSFDMWSTVGIVTANPGPVPDAHHERWVKNW